MEKSTLPPCLSQLTCLTSLAVGGFLQDTAVQALDAALPCLVLLRRSALWQTAGVPVLSGFTKKKKLHCAAQPATRLHSGRADHRGCCTGGAPWRALALLAGVAGKLIVCTNGQFEAAAGCMQPALMRRSAQHPQLARFIACLLSSLVQGMPYRMAATNAANGVLSAVSQLEHFCFSGWPEKGSSGGVQDGDGSWEAFWRFLKHHPSLRCFTVDTDQLPGSLATPNTAAVDALLDLRCCRPALQLRRTPQEGGYAFWNDMLECDSIPEGAGL